MAEEQLTKYYKGPADEMVVGDDVYHVGDEVTGTQAFFDEQRAAGYSFVDEPLPVPEPPDPEEPQEPVVKPPPTP